MVSPPLREVVLYPEKLIGADSQSFSQKIDEVLSLRKNAAYLYRLCQIAQANT